MMSSRRNLVHDVVPPVMTILETVLKFNFKKLHLLTEPIYVGIQYVMWCLLFRRIGAASDVLR